MSGASLASEFVARCRTTSTDEHARTFAARVQYGNELIAQAQAANLQSQKGCSRNILGLYDSIAKFMAGLNLDERLYILTKLESAMLYDAVEYVKSVHCQVVDAQMERKRQAELQRLGLAKPSPIPQGFNELAVPKAKPKLKHKEDPLDLLEDI